MKKAQLIIVLGLTATIALLSIRSTHHLNPIQDEATTKFDINDFSWLSGHWTGEGFGGVSEEIWSPPADGTMMGMFRQLNDEKLVFYEFLLLDETGLRLKHFHPDLKGWETKDEFVTFEMVEYTKKKIVLKGLEFELKSKNEMEIRLSMRQGDEVKTEVFNMKRS